MKRSPTARGKQTRDGQMQENHDIFDFELTAEDLAQIAAMDTGSSLFFDHRDPVMVSQIGNRHLDI